MSRSRRRWTVALGWIVSGVLLVGIASTVPLREVWSALKRVRLGFVVIAAGLAASSILLRGVRWSLLFRPRYSIPVKEASSLVILGLALNATLPARAGELARIGLTARRFGIGLGFTTVTVVTERLLDALTLMTFLGGAVVLLPPLEPGRSVTVLGSEIDTGMVSGALRGTALLAFLFVLLLLIVNARLSRHFLRRWCSRLIGLVSDRAQTRLTAWLDDLASALTPLRTPRVAFGLIAYSLVIWIAVATCNQVVAWGMPGLRLSFSQVLLLTAVSTAASSLPSAPGAWGVYEAGAMISLVASGADAQPATLLGYVLVIHLCQYLPIMALGVAVAVRRTDTFRALNRLSRNDVELSSPSMDRRRSGTESDVGAGDSRPERFDSIREG